MIRRNTGRTVSFGAICLTLLLISFVSASAAGCEFSLSDAQVKKGRIFTLSLECKADREICAFIAEIEYDTDALEYRSAKVTDKSAEYSVNATEEGKLRLVYLCEEGVNCKGKTPLMEFNFKALQSGVFQVSINAQQVIDINSSEIAVSKAEGAFVSVGTTAAQNNSQRVDSDKSEKVESKGNTEAEETTKIDGSNGYSKGYTGVEGVDYDVVLIVASVTAVLVLLCLVGFCAYKYGVKVTIKKKEQELIDGFSSDKQGKK